jgi:hypothetical protein
VFATRTASGRIILTREISLNYRAIRDPDGKTKTTYFLNIKGYSNVLKALVGTGKDMPIENLKMIAHNDQLRAEAAQLFEAIGKDMAESAGLDLVVIQYDTTAPFSGQTLNISGKIGFERKGGIWKIIPKL